MSVCVSTKCMSVLGILSKWVLSRKFTSGTFKTKTNCYE